tara:strand:- start:35 stop:445 length:411 start_codon:yes stop_codon:yes gene_type:complete
MENKPWNSIWINKEKNEFEVFQTNTKPITLKKGSWVKIPCIGDESNNKCIIDYVFHSKKNNKDKGPIGITYLPWIEDENKFADVTWSIKGNKRYIVCYPEGMRNYGRHIDWDMLEVCESPNSISDEQIQNALDIEY